MRRRRLRTVYPLQRSLAPVIACRGRRLAYVVVSHDRGAIAPVVVFPIAPSAACAPLHLTFMVWCLFSGVCVVVRLWCNCRGEMGQNARPRCATAL